MNAKIKVIQKRNNSTEIVISGELTIYSAMELYQQHLQAIKLKELVIIKLAAVSEIDTAGMQLLVLLFKEIVNQEVDSILHSVSPIIMDYAALFNLEHYFPTPTTKGEK